MTNRATNIFAAAAMVVASTAFAQQGQAPTYGPLREPVPVPGASCD